MNKTMCFPLSASFQGRDDDDEEEKTAAVSAYLVSVWDLTYSLMSFIIRHTFY